MKRPNQYNISKGDILIAPLGKGLSRLFIKDLRENCILAFNDMKITTCSYEEAVVVRKKDNKYFFGINAENRLRNQGFGGIRLVNDN